ncbi:MAG: copper resistance protein CopC, partial [Aquiluna sp.]
LDQPGKYQVAWRVVSSDGHPIAGDFGFEIVNDSGYVANPNFGYPDCKEEVSIEIGDQNPQFLYWVLWLSMGAVAAALFLFLRPKKNVEPAEGSQN